MHTYCHKVPFIFQWPMALYQWHVFWLVNWLTMHHIIATQIQQGLVVWPHVELRFVLKMPYSIMQSFTRRELCFRPISEPWKNSTKKTKKSRPKYTTEDILTRACLSSNSAKSTRFFLKWFILRVLKSISSR